MINGAIGGINTLIGAVNAVPGVHVPTLGRIPHLASGGIATRPTVALIGESGPEAIVPLNSGGRMGSMAGGGINITVPVTAGVVGSEQQIARAVTTALINALRSGLLNPNELKAALGV